MFSSDPIITYIENYLSPAEIEYLLKLAKPLYQQSPVSQGKRLKTYNAEIRSSMSAVLGGNDPVVRCIEQRSVDFQGFLPRSHLEDLQVVKYGISDHFRPHFDWFGGDSNPRISSFFVYIACDADDTNHPGAGECKGGATQFPDYTGAFPAKWCQFIDCHDDSGVGGVAFKPIPGNAIFWGNLYPNGTGHPGTWHAGMPVTQGRKVGMNILTRRERLVGV
ncbi:uncharacterized protein B0I36DRAFT_424902 [Microdochium trichocladiopsis]|uniref:Fe2OG dioxygenase domain-containing protein n=1 Tax=Microdochium trichocladiopsis TaxID=1682393 RepID=A0A9P8XYT3_9PEZI|nr:uncharacterized protein B0I36DRAFT_424902 [Microdochium trichocladiopsis]KAH7021009.1 hypothetical protein B0I36DRAFT_424902 [Microdochium trichocladiopsis]